MGSNQFNCQRGTFAATDAQASDATLFAMPLQCCDQKLALHGVAPVL